MFTKKGYTIFLIALFSIAGFGSVLFTTSRGIGISPDSVVYIDVARNILHGKGAYMTNLGGEEIPLTIFPPLFSATLSMIGIFGIDPMSTARWLNAFLFGLNILLVGLMINRYTKGFIWYAPLGSFLMLTSGLMLQIHSMAWTEPMFFFWGLLGLFILANYFENPNYFALLLSSVSIALACLTRYAGVALIATGIIGILILSRKRYFERFRDSVIFAFAASLPIALWLIRNLYLSGTSTHREIAFHPPNFLHMKTAIITISRWILPAVITPPIIKGILALTILVLPFLMIFFLYKKQRKQTNDKSFIKRLPIFPCLLLIFILAYELLLLIIISFFQARLYPIGRILSPAYICWLVLIILLFHDILHTMNKSRFLRIIFMVFFITLSGSYICRGVVNAFTIYNNGKGYASRQWHNSEIIKEIRTMPPGTLIFSNGPDAVYILTGKHAAFIPRKADSISAKINDYYDSELLAMKDQLKERNGILVYFNTIGWRWYLPKEEELMEELSLRLVLKASDGAVYKIDTSNKKWK